MAEPESQKRSLDRLAGELGENPAVVGMFVARMAGKLRVPVQLVIERLTALVQQLKQEAHR